MNILKHQYIDIHYDKHEEKSAKKYGKTLEKRGYKLEHEDAGGNHDFCDQYWKDAKILKVSKDLLDCL